MDSLKYYPFKKATIKEDESVIWTGSNPTFHRSGEWALIITDKAVYYFSPFWGFLSKWKRYDLCNIEDLNFKDSRYFPKLEFIWKGKRIKLRTPHDSYKDEMDFDRGKLKEAEREINKLIHLTSAGTAGQI